MFTNNEKRKQKIGTFMWVWCIFIKMYEITRKNFANSEQNKKQNCKLNRKINRISKLNRKFVIVYFQSIHLQSYHNEAKIKDDYFGRTLLE